MSRYLLCSTALGLALGFAPAAFGQQSSTTPMTTPPNTSTTPPQAARDDTTTQSAIPPRGSQIETVTVTAERRVANLQKTPISITTVSGKTITQTSLATLDAVLQQIPALNVAGDPHGSEISIRGVGANGDSNFIDNDVVSMYDEVYNGRAEGTTSAMYDVNQVEVLRGPQGTLYGRNAIGGVINILTNNPSTAKFSTGVNFTAGNYGLLHSDGYVNVPITDEFAIRAAVDVTKRDGYISNGGDSDHAFGYRVKALYRPNADFSLLADIDYWHQTGLGADSVSAANPFTQLGGPPFFNWPVDTKNPWKQLDNDHPADTDNFKFVTYSLKAIYQVADLAVVTLIPSYSYNSRYELTNLVVGDTPQIGASLTPGTYQDNQYTGELRISNTPDSKFIWVTGLYYLNDKNYGTGAGETTAATPGDYYAQFGSNAPTTSKSVFGQGTYPITNRLRLTGGIRYTEDSKSIGFGVCTTEIGTLTCTSPSSSYYYYQPQVNYKLSYSATTYKAGLEYDIAPKVLAYLQTASGYKAGGFDTNAYPPATYEPEHLTAYELGLKSRWLDDSLQINAEAYYYRYRNLQIQYSFNGCPPLPVATVAAAAAAGGVGNFCAADVPEYMAGDQGPFQQFVLNSATSTNVGGEAEVKWRFEDDNEIDVSPAYTDAKYGNIPASSGYGFLSNTPVVQAPKFTVSAAYERDFENMWGGAISAHGDVKYSTGYFLNVAENNQPTNFAGDYQGCFFIENASATYTPNKGNYVVTLWGKNLANKAVKDYALPLGRVLLNDPRTFGGTIGVTF